MEVWEGRSKTPFRDDFISVPKYVPDFSLDNTRATYIYEILFANNNECARRLYRFRKHSLKTF